VTVAERAVSAAEQQYQAKLADLRNAEAQNAKAQRDVERFRPLVAKEEISKQQFDAVRATAESQTCAVQYPCVTEP
jgi:membrane fusion protein (multidrug efflux system)